MWHRSGAESVQYSSIPEWLSLAVYVNAFNRKLTTPVSVFSAMTDYEYCLAGCGQALAEAQLLVAKLAAIEGTLGLDLGPFLARIATLEREVERLRGLPIVRLRTKTHPDWIYLSSDKTPWCADDASGVA